MNLAGWPFFWSVLRMKKYIREHRYVLLVLYLPIYLIWFALVEHFIASPDMCWESYIPLDDQIPFLPPFILAYVSWYPFLALPAIVLLVCRLFQVPYIVTAACTLLSGMPAASLTAVLAARYHGDSELGALLVAVPLFFFYIIFYPLSVVMQKASSFVIKYILRTRSEEQPQSLLPGRVDFDNLVSMQAEKNPDDSEVGLEAKLMRNALDFSKIKVRDCYIPRTDMVAININESVDHLHKKFVSSGYSKILVFNGSIDNIVGYVHVSEMFKGSKSIRSMMSPIAVVPETMRANLLLKQFTSQHKSIAIVVDEFGGTSGLITLEDVLEEIFGEINDEHDDDDLIDERLDDETYVFSGRMEVDDINEKYGVHLPTSDDYDTLAGLILSETQSIPREGDVVEVDRFEFKVLQAGHTTVDKIQMRVKD